jgi:1-acyl-sn-glycerol-3-phosphate acyltransferase
MQNVIIDKPYRFIPPHRGTWWPSLIRRLNVPAMYLRRTEGIVSHEIRGLYHFLASFRAGHGIMLAPNHCRAGDPMTMGWVARAAQCNVYAMASWHLFHQHWLNAWAIRKMGGFSVHREGVDRPAINTAIDILTTAERPLILFPEGAVSRTNDRLMSLLDGVAFIARTAAKRRARLKPHGEVVIHPVAIKYLYRGDLPKAADAVLTSIEHRLTWQPQRNLPLLHRIAKVGDALLTLKEIELFAAPQSGTLADRLQRCIDGLLHPLEQEWLKQPQCGAVVPRVKTLRMRLLPEMVQNQLSQAERDHRWQQLAKLYLAQQLSCYPPDYLTTRRSVDRILETLERFEEDLTDQARPHEHLHAVIWIDEPIAVPHQRDRQQDDDPIMSRLAQRLQQMLDQLALESPLLGEAFPQAVQR